MPARPETLACLLAFAALPALPALAQEAPHAAHAQQQQQPEEEAPPTLPMQPGLYRCPMHPDVASEAPGRCPRCGMALQADPAPEHAGHAGHAGHAAAPGGDTSHEAHAGHAPAAHAMPAAPLGLGMEREGSGTAWQPDATPVLGHHLMPGAGWMLMLHYNVHAGFDWQDGPRGDSQFTSDNWVMLMGEHALGGGLFAGRLMLSAEPLTTGGKAGYPLLLQSGETVDGVLLHDRQHPHDLFMELAGSWRRALGRSLALELYLAPAGEPALGPVAFPHRYSASMNPFAALGHHWQDSTHIAFGVATVALYGQRWKVEGSWFNGREPDEDRYDLDLRAPDSYAGRVTVNPTRELSVQASAGYLKSPEAHAPDEDLVRLTASVQYTRALARGAWATTAVWGQNRGHGGVTSNAVLLESLLERGPHAVFGRAELAQKSGEELALPHELLGEDHHRLFDVGTVQLGYVYHLPPVGGVQLGLGALGAVNPVPGALEDPYGSRLPLGGMLYLHLRPAPAWTQPQPQGSGSRSGGTQPARAAGEPSVSAR